MVDELNSYFSRMLQQALSNTVTLLRKIAQELRHCFSKRHFFTSGKNQCSALGTICLLFHGMHHISLEASAIILVLHLSEPAPTQVSWFWFVSSGGILEDVALHI